jgi:hypothetical protein
VGLILLLALWSQIRFAILATVHELVRLIVLTECSPIRLEFIVNCDVLTQSRKEYWLLLLVLAFGEFSVHVCFVLDEESSLDIVESPGGKAVWLMHVQP